jgi:hypothetical protein
VQRKKGQVRKKKNPTSEGGSGIATFKGNKLMKQIIMTMGQQFVTPKLC